MEREFNNPDKVQKPDQTPTRLGSKHSEAHSSTEHTDDKDCCDHGHGGDGVVPRATGSKQSISQPPEPDNHGDHSPGDDHDHDHGDDGNAKATGFVGLISANWFSALMSFLLLLSGLILDYGIKPNWFTGAFRFVWYLVAYLPVGLPILFRGIKYAFRGDVFTEFLLMSLATVGAFYIGEYPEGVAVMVFYAIGELFQDAAVSRAKRSIKALLDVRPDVAEVERNGTFVTVDPQTVHVGEIIRVKPGDRVALDGTMISIGSSFNAAALTGESKPTFIEKEGTVLAGMISEDRVADLRVTRPFNESSLARILTLVQNAQGRKAKTELFIRKFARFYTPVVVLLAGAVTLLPYFFLEDYNFQEWLYRALVFLVISCPCALVVAIPLGYFGGIGAGSRNGILFKGSSYLDRMTRIGTVVMDKTGTLTQGVFKVQQVKSVSNDHSWLYLASELEQQSRHPIAKAIVSYVTSLPPSSHEKLSTRDATEVRGQGLRGIVNGREVLAGNVKLLASHNVQVDDLSALDDTVVVVAIDGKYCGYVTIADQVKPDASDAISRLHALGITTVMLSGDKQSVVVKVAAQLHIGRAVGDLLPEDKVAQLEDIKKGLTQAVAFVGDGINDAPVLAISDVGIAMGGLGSDVAIETADVVIQTDQPSKIATAIRIGRATKSIVWQNIALAFAVKVLVMALGAWGIASLWEAVFADVGVALVAILNAVRIQRMKFA